MTSDWLPPQLPDPLVPPAADAIGLVPGRILLVKHLMVLLGRVELRRRLDRGDDRRLEPVGLVQRLLRRVCQPPLVRVTVEDDRAILRAVVAEGRVGREWV